MKIQSSHLRAAILAAAGLALAAPAVSDVVSSATYINGNIDATKFGGSETHTSTVAQSLLTTELGYASASAHTAPGALAGGAAISMDATQYGGAALEAKAQARTREMLHFGTDYCVNEVCRSAASLGVTALNIDFAIHASGGTSAFATDPRFDHAIASIGYNYALTNGVGFTASGGGARERHETGQAVGDIHSMTASLAVRPGETLELLMSMSVFAGANASAWNFSGFTATHVAALADFTHTLLWDGITAFTAYDAAGNEVALAPGGHFQLLGDSGTDFWYAAPGFDSAPTSVPEPASVALLLTGLALLRFWCSAGAVLLRVCSPRRLTAMAGSAFNPAH
ncbi:MAG: PEP-CTERM sorting domain-containing protein [Ideonella sp.]|nr:PEP-CTERM sorting domain-containing protein [Ideonella sp.]